ncbi:MAG: hypothetical protein DRG73_03040, partial [Deltaproteobacteria bacterium]
IACILHITSLKPFQFFCARLTPKRMIWIASFGNVEPHLDRIIMVMIVLFMSLIYKKKCLNFKK